MNPSSKRGRPRRVCHPGQVCEPAGLGPNIRGFVTASCGGRSSSVRRRAWGSWGWRNHCWVMVGWEPSPGMNEYSIWTTHGLAWLGLVEDTWGITANCPARRIVLQCSQAQMPRPSVV
ncbi:hypothetical protein BDV59DRAFT_100338 [Aspergillus ambiguus]|uniref:uncharacterized protein n=1 Tax=Aspergillus ambiguus TaxID=176160 RepID=UPI003CCD30EA